MGAVEKWADVERILEVEPPGPTDGFSVDERKGGIKDDSDSWLNQLSGG